MGFSFPCSLAILLLVPCSSDPPHIQGFNIELEHTRIVATKTVLAIKLSFPSFLGIQVPDKSKEQF